MFSLILSNLHFECYWTEFEDHALLESHTFHLPLGLFHWTSLELQKSSNLQIYIISLRYCYAFLELPRAPKVQTFRIIVFPTVFAFGLALLNLNLDLFRTFDNRFKFSFRLEHITSTSQPFTNYRFMMTQWLCFSLLHHRFLKSLLKSGCKKSGKFLEILKN